TYAATTLCEPQLGKRGLYIEFSQKEGFLEPVLDLLAYSDGRRDLCEIAGIMGFQGYELKDLARTLLGAGLLREL
ncbi:winged helix-turn-helix domain-containing protein, partial [Campylobacter sp.]|uniref:winged helix-turn-helix domain-containing protein n=1 Tax=Campylobacter sp. TaxID=205 RepID=UPI0026DC478F